MTGKPIYKSDTKSSNIYPFITQHEFEVIVRSTYNDIKHGMLTGSMDTFDLAIETTKVIAILERQPDLLDNYRLRYNLGRKKTQWLDSLWNKYLESKEKDKYGKMD